MPHLQNNSTAVLHNGILSYKPYHYEVMPFLTMKVSDNRRGISSANYDMVGDAPISTVTLPPIAEIFKMAGCDSSPTQRLHRTPRSVVGRPQLVTDVNVLGRDIRQRRFAPYPGHLKIRSDDSNIFSPLASVAPAVTKKFMREQPGVGVTDHASANYTFRLPITNEQPPPMSKHKESLWFISPMTGSSMTFSEGLHRFRLGVDRPAPRDAPNIVCGISSCGRVLPNDRLSVMTHMTKAHLAKGHSYDTTQISCPWVSSTGIECETKVATNGLSRHVLDMHTSLLHVKCPHCHQPLRKDTLSRHGRTCPNNPSHFLSSE